MELTMSKASEQATAEQDAAATGERRARNSFVFVFLLLLSSDKLNDQLLRSLTTVAAFPAVARTRFPTPLSRRHVGGRAAHKRDEVRPGGVFLAHRVDRNVRSR
jgi:hypothetical protein